LSDYKASGVDREAAATWIQELSPAIQSSFRPEILTGIGGFAAAFRVPESIKNPVLMATTDGVGTKLMLAGVAGDESFFGIGIDLVAMCVNDLLACRAEPLIFLDYLATDRLNRTRATKLIKGVVEGCRQSLCSLVGGETAEMPGFYSSNRMDVAGFSVGVVDQSKLWRRDLIQAGDFILGVASSGFHSNGYSLVRKLLIQENWTLDSQVEGEVLGEAILKPTRLYVRDLLPVCLQDEVKAGVHITGGGLVENLPRCFPKNLKAKVQTANWEAPALMQAFVERLKVEKTEAYSTWNMGVGFCIIASPKKSEELLKESPNLFFRVGELIERNPQDQDSVELC